MKKKWRLLGSVILIAVLAWRIDWAQAGAALARANWALWAAGLGVYLFAQAVSAVRWRMLARVQGFGGSPGRYLAYYFIGMFFNLLLPTSIGGDMVRAVVPGHARGVGPAREKRRAAAFLSVFGDRINGLVALVAVACLAAVCCPTPLPPWLRWTVAGLGGATLFGVLAAAVAVALPPPPGQLRWVWECAGEFREHPRTMLVATLLSFVVQLSNAVLLGLMGAALGLPVPPAYYGVVAPLVALTVAVCRSASTAWGCASWPRWCCWHRWASERRRPSLWPCYPSPSPPPPVSAGPACLLLGRFPRPEEVRRDDDAVGGDSDQGRTRQPPAAA